MSRITASEARGMMEAYTAVYAPQELTEEQIWEEVENWVNSLLEEGYDLSDYTWEEMYEDYLKEDAQGLGSSLRQKFGQARRAFGDVAGAYAQGFMGQKTTSSNPIARSYNAVSRTVSAPTRAIGDFAKGFVTGKGAEPAHTKPPAPKPPASTPPAAAKTAPTRPAAPAKPATGMLGKTSFERRTPTSAELKAAQTARAGGANPEQALQAAKAAGTTSKVQSAGQSAGAKAFSSPTAGASAFKPATVASAPSTSPSASGSVAPATAAIASTPKPTPVSPRQTAREKVLNQSYEYDAYDLVLEYLLSNGHADTVDEAHYVMLEMEAEVIQDIVEETRRTEYLQKKFNKENKRKSGSAHTAIPGKQNTGQALQKARESERHMSGDK